MKIQRKEEMVKTGYRLPTVLKRAIDEMAVAERRSTNDELIVLLERGLQWSNQARNGLIDRPVSG